MSNSYINDDISYSIDEKLSNNYSRQSIKYSLIETDNVINNKFHKESFIVYDNILTENILCRIHSYYIFTNLNISNGCLTQYEINEIQNSNLSNNIKNKIFLDIGINISNLCDDLIRDDLFNNIFNINSLDELIKNKDFLVQYEYYPHYSEYFDIYNMSLVNLRKYFKLVNSKENIEIIWNFFNNNNEDY